MNTQYTKKQHIVPCRFLANFSKNPELKRKALIWTYNKNTKKYNQASVESVFYENDIYTINIGNSKKQTLENIFAELESLCMPYIDKFIKRDGFSFENQESNIPLEDENAFVQQFIVSLLIRHPKYVKKAIFYEKELFNGDIKGFLYARNFKRNLDNNITRINQTRDLHSYKATGGNFILNDNYSTAVNFQELPLPQEIEKQARENGTSISILTKLWNELSAISAKHKSETYGPAIIFCPISPEIAIGLTHKSLNDNSKKNYGKTTFLMSQRKYSELGVKMIHQKTFQQARNFIYARNKETLEQIVNLSNAKFES